MNSMTSNIEYTIEEEKTIVDTLTFTEEKKNRLGKTDETFKGIEHAKGLGTSVIATTDIDWKEDELKNHTSYRAFPSAWDDQSAEKYQLACAVLLIAATHSMNLPVPQSQVAEVVVVHLMNTIGYAQSDFTTGSKFLALKFVTKLVTKVSEYSWPGFSLFVSKIRADFMERMKNGNYEKFDDLFVVYESVQKPPESSSAQPRPASELSQLGRPVVDQAVETVARPTSSSDTETISTVERALIQRIKHFHSTRQLISVGIALAYTLGRLVAKSVEHVIRIGQDFATLPLRYGLDMNPTTTFNFNENAITAIRNNIAPYASTIATYLQSLLEATSGEPCKLSIPQKCAIQIKALFEIRLSFFGMVLPALGLSVADKLNITGENLAYISMCDLTRDGCKQFLDFLARLENQEPKYREARGFSEDQKINPRGSFRFCRLFNSEYMMKLSGTKNRNTSFLWMYIQRNLTKKTSPDAVRASDLLFSGMPDIHVRFLGHLGDLIINFHAGHSSLNIVPEIDTAAAIIVKQRMQAKSQPEAHKFTNIVHATVKPGEDTPSQAGRMSKEEFFNMASKR